MLSLLRRMFPLFLTTTATCIHQYTPLLLSPALHTTFLFDGCHTYVGNGTQSTDPSAQQPSTPQPWTHIGILCLTLHYGWKLVHFSQQIDLLTHAECTTRHSHVQDLQRSVRVTVAFVHIFGSFTKTKLQQRVRGRGSLGMAVGVVRRRGALLRLLVILVLINPVVTMMNGIDFDYDG